MNNLASYALATPSSLPNQDSHHSRMRAIVERLIFNVPNMPTRMGKNTEK
jgi:hypothetical protein